MVKVNKLRSIEITTDELEFLIWCLNGVKELTKIGTEAANEPVYIKADEVLKKLELYKRGKK